MENRKSFILHFDSLDVIEELTDEQAWKLLKKMKSYHNGNTYDPKDKLIDILFIQFKNQFDRDIQKYDKTCERNKNNVGKRWNKEDTKNTSGISGIKSNTKNTYNDSKSDNDNDSKNKSDSKTIQSLTVVVEKTELELLLIEFKRARAKLRKPMTDKAMDLLLKKLSEYSEQEQIEMLEEAIEKWWQSVYPKKEKLKQWKNLDRSEAMAKFNIT